MEWRKEKRGSRTGKGKRTWKARKRNKCLGAERETERVVNREINIIISGVKLTRGEKIFEGGKKFLKESWNADVEIREAWNMRFNRVGEIVLTKLRLKKKGYDKEEEYKR